MRLIVTAVSLLALTSLATGCHLLLSFGARAPGAPGLDSSTETGISVDRLSAGDSHLLSEARIVKEDAPVISNPDGKGPGSEGSPAGIGPTVVHTTPTIDLQVPSGTSLLLVQVAAFGSVMPPAVSGAPLKIAGMAGSNGLFAATFYLENPPAGPVTLTINTPASHRLTAVTMLSGVKFALANGGHGNGPAASALLATNAELLLDIVVAAPATTLSPATGQTVSSQPSTPAMQMATGVKWGGQGNFWTLGTPGPWALHLVGLVANP